MIKYNTVIKPVAWELGPMHIQLPGELIPIHIQLPDFVTPPTPVPIPPPVPVHPVPVPIPPTNEIQVLLKKMEIILWGIEEIIKVLPRPLLR